MKLKEVKDQFTAGQTFYHVSAWHVGYRVVKSAHSTHAKVNFTAHPEKGESIFTYPCTQDHLAAVPQHPGAFFHHPAHFPVNAASLWVPVTGQLSPEQEKALRDKFVELYTERYNAQRAAA